MSAQVASLQLNVEHLKKQSEMNRIKVSEASKEYVITPLHYLLMDVQILSLLSTLH